jgi:hypothetical protein
MKDLATEIVDELEPPHGWQDEDNRAELIDVALNMLKFMSVDDVLENMRTMFRAISSEYGE